eukprot:m.76601 g.76601  ORF g.76601 m.76601 type:complete len:127 (+) comp17237_c0_seq2:251-631(+)
MEELLQCVLEADVLKPAKHAAQDVVAALGASRAYKHAGDLAQQLRELSGARLVALTGGSEGCTLATENKHAVVPPFALQTVVDATGAGDAFLGGLLAGLHHDPQTTDLESASFPSVVNKARQPLDC